MYKKYWQIIFSHRGKRKLLFFKYGSCTQNNTEKKNKGFKIDF